MRNKKVLHLLMVGVVSLGIILAGAFAWVSFTQTALNIFEGWTNPDVNIHDDFDEPNKDVYVENSGKRPLYVRVKFDEFMEIDGSSIISDPQSVKGDLNSWLTHAYAGAASDADYCGEELHDYYEWIMGNSADDLDQGWKHYLAAPFENRALFDETGVQLRNPTAVEYKDDEEFYGFYMDVEDSPGSGTYTNQLVWLTRKEAYAHIDTTMKTAATDTQFTTPTYNGVLPTDGVAGIADFPGGTNAQYLAWLYSVIDFNSTGLTATNSAAGANLQAKRVKIEADRAAASAELARFLEDNEIGYYTMSYSVKSNLNAQGASLYNSMAFETDALKNDAEVNGVTLHEYLIDQGLLENGTPEFVPVARTQKTQNVYTMAQWIAAGMPEGNFWVMDTDGWCYWADVLPPTQTTGLLLSEVILNELEPPSGVWWYGINVSLQAVTADDIPKLFATAGDAGTIGGGATEQGEMLLNSISGKYVYGVAATGINQGDGTLQFDAETVTYERFKDNTYRMRIDDGSNVTYGPWFVYTGSTGFNVTDMRNLYDAFNVNAGGTTPGDTFNDESEYKIGTSFWKLAKITPETWVEFTVVDAADGGTFPSGVMQAANGKHYVKLNYDGNNVAWLAVGSNGVFDALTTTAPSWQSAPSGYGSGDKISNNDDLLIWTEEAEPGIDDRYEEEQVAKTLRVGDIIPNVDGHDWLVLGKDADGSGNPTAGKTLIISVDAYGPAVEKQGTSAGNISAELAKYKTGGDALCLTELVAADGTIEVILLTAQEAIDYFASNQARATDAKWWIGTDATTIDSSIIGLNGSFATTASDDEEVNIRPALWIKSQELYDLVYPAP